MSRDELYRQAGSGDPGRFDFGEATAAVFDDMLERSVPFYRELQRMLAEIAADRAVAGSRLYDLGCSTGTTLVELDRTVDPGVAFVGVDASPEMLQRCREKLRRLGSGRSIELLCADLNDPPPLADASVVVLNLTLQFVRPRQRGPLLAAVATALRPGGCLLLVEKVRGGDAALDADFIRYHHAFKRRNGYSALEIARKRDALEDVLIPYTAAANHELLRRSGFRTTEGFFRWYNFCGILALR